MATKNNDSSNAKMMRSSGTCQRRKNIIMKALTYILATVIALVVLIPFFWMLSTSLKSRGALMSIPIEWLPKEPNLNSFKRIFAVNNFGTSIFNSFYLAIASTIVQLTFATMAAFAFSKLRFRGREQLFKIYIATMMIPFQVLFIPLYIVMSKMNLVNSINALLLLQMFNAFAIFMLRQKMMTISDSFVEAAKIDGASAFTIYARIILPLSSGTIATLVVLAFMGSWNDYLFPLVMLQSKDKFTLPLILSSLNGQYTTEYNLLMAGSLISILPILIIYICMQKYFKSGLQVGGVKG